MASNVSLDTDTERDTQTIQTHRHTHHRVQENKLLLSEVRSLLGFLSCTKGHHKPPLKDRWKENREDHANTEAGLMSPKPRSTGRGHWKWEEGRDRLLMEPPLRVQPP